MLLVTGATGFLGRHLIPRLVSSGYAVRALARPSSDTTFLQTQPIELAYAADITDADGVARAIAGCEGVIHAAGHFRFWGDRDWFWQTNVRGTETVVAAAQQAGVARFVHVSTIAVVGQTPDGVIDETTPCQPLDPYMASKLAAETAVLAAHTRHNLPAVIIRPGGFYGPHGHYALNRLFFTEPLRGWRIRVDGGRRITFPVYVADVAQGIQLALEKGTPGEIYNISGPSLSHNQINAIVSQQAGISPWRLSIPKWAVLALARTWTAVSTITHREPFYPINLAPYVFQDWRVSTAKAQHHLGFQPTPFEEGARLTLEWYKESKSATQPVSTSAKS